MSAPPKLLRSDATDNLFSKSIDPDVSKYADRWLKKTRETKKAQSDGGKRRRTNRKSRRKRKSRKSKKKKKSRKY